MIKFERYTLLNMLHLYSQHGWNSPDDAILHHLPITEGFH